MVPPSYIWSVVERKFVMQRLPSFTPWRPEFNLQAFIAGFMVHNVEPEQIFVRILWVFLFNVIPPIFRMGVYRRCIV
jgi:hypothetical protein